MQYLTEMVVKQANQFVIFFAHKAKSLYNLPSPKKGSFFVQRELRFDFFAFFKIRGISTGGEMVQRLRANHAVSIFSVVFKIGGISTGVK